MTDDVRRQVAEMESMTVGELKRRYQEVFGEPARSGNKRWLFRRIAWRLQSLDEGDLSERAKFRAAELARDADARVRPPKDWLVAPAPAGLRTFSGRLEVSRDERIPPHGTELVRDYKGQQHRVTVLDGGFEYDGRAYRSLSAIAHAITGSHWNGYHFFGISKPRKKSA